MILIFQLSMICLPFCSTWNLHGLWWGWCYLVFSFLCCVLCTVVSCFGSFCVFPWHYHFGFWPMRLKVSIAYFAFSLAAVWYRPLNIRREYLNTKVRIDFLDNKRQLHGKHNKDILITFSLTSPFCSHISVPFQFLTNKSDDSNNWYNCWRNCNAYKCGATCIYKNLGSILLCLLFVFICVFSVLFACCFLL